MIREFECDSSRQRSFAYLCDVVFLSYAKSEEYRNMTQFAVNSILRSEDEGAFNIIVEEQADVMYEGAKTIYRTDEFNFNEFANHGATLGSAPWICIANNDLVFKPGWFTELMKNQHLSDVLSPASPKNPLLKGFITPQFGYNIHMHFSGWCFVMKRELWEKIGGFDEDFPFWCADNAVVEQLKTASITPVVIPTSIVKHLGGTTLNSLEQGEYNEKTIEQVSKFNKKYNQNLFNIGN